MLEAGTRLRREEDNVVGNEKFERPFGMGFEFCGSRSQCDELERHKQRIAVLHSILNRTVVLRRP